MNVLKEKRFSLVELVHHFFTETKETGISSFEDFQVVFIFDGLDECRLPLDFHETAILTDPRESTSLDVLLINLIRGELLPYAHIWITTRPAAANQIPPDCVHMVTEVRGFTDPQKEKYFKKRFKDTKQARRIIISHIKRSRSLYIMCHIPVFCWITATVMEDVLETREGGQLPKTLTEMYIQFLVVQAKMKKAKYDGGAETDSPWSPENSKMIESLGKLAFDQLQKGNLIFYKSDIRECGINIKAASVYSGVFTQIFKEESGLYQHKVFCFIHLSVQEFLAALHVHLTFINSGLNLLEEQQGTSRSFKPSFHQSAVNKALESPNGHWDLFLRFLLGLSLQTNQNLLQDLLTKTGSYSQTNQETVQYIKKKLSENLSVEKSINLLHCLNELNDRSLVEEIQQSLTSGSLSTDELSPAQWSALVFILLSSEKDLDVFDLKKYSASEEALLRLLPVVKASNKALLSGCCLSERSCEALSPVLSSKSSSLKEVNLNNNNLQDSGVKLLSAALQSPHCTLETLSIFQICIKACNHNSATPRRTLSNTKSSNYFRQLQCILIQYFSCFMYVFFTSRLSGCFLSEKSCEALSSVLNSQSSSLKELDLSNNNLQDSSVTLLSVLREKPHCTLECLRLSGCFLSRRSYDVLASVLRSQSSSLRKLILSKNNLQDSVIKLLSAALRSPHCTLKTLRLNACNLLKRSCEDLTSVLCSQSSHLRELDLSDNDLEDSGVKLLSAAVASPHCTLESLSLSRCLITEEGCTFLVSALSSNPSHLRELDLNDGLITAAGLCLFSPSDSCQLTIDTNTVNTNLKLSDSNRKVTRVEEVQSYPDHPDRFDGWSQLLCRNGLTGRCYWEVEWRGQVYMSVSYRRIGRKGDSGDCVFGNNDQSWSLYCSGVPVCVYHNNKRTSISSSSASNRVAVYVDCPAGTLSFYSVSSETLIHLHTFNTTFTESLYPGFTFRSPGSSVSLYEVLDAAKPSCCHGSGSL
uniref:B30.2/SPRY domain-containing protein n=1 Tax=Astatotilapia calliptera TaxID=8154 RepID=A0AAX7VMQ2_ASTCA